jgi:ppGpp synthetase/RelA/SpoT-type nucleotidyltranferase
VNADKAKAWASLYNEHRNVLRVLAERSTRFINWKALGYFRTKYPDRGLPVVFQHQFRAKSGWSLLENLVGGEKYRPLEGRDPALESLLGEVKDLAAGRIIFFFRDDLDEFGKEIENKRAVWFGPTSQLKFALEKEPGQRTEPFGYDSIHLTARATKDSEFFGLLSEDERSMLAERSWPFEIQLRTFFQHGWAEPEHELRYKAPAPADGRQAEENRWWGLLAALVEACDRILADRKRLMTQHTPARGERLPPAWSYNGYEGDKRAANLVERDGVVYGYELLHEAGINGRQPLLKVRPPIVNFDLDAAMQEIHGLADYKHAVWRELKRKAPDFAAAMAFDERVVRVRAFDAEALELQLEPAQYSDQMVTNHRRAHDITINGQEVRSLAFQPGSANNLRGFSESAFSNTIGISMMVRTREGKWIAALRSPHLAHEPGSWGTSASGALTWSVPDRWNGKKGIDLEEASCQEVQFEDWLKEGMAAECEEELGFRPSTDKIHYLGFAREWARLGKPQFFFLIEEDHTFEELEQRWALYAYSREHTELKPWTDDEAKVLVGSGESTDEVGRLIGDNGLSEELRFNLRLALDAVAT